MGISQQLAAMLFELRSAGSPLAKAKALARAWRMIRRLSPSDRKVLAEEAGFEGAEEMLESLAAKSGGVAPALMLQLLNNVREQGSEGLSDLMTGLRSLEARDEILLRGADAVALAFAPPTADDDEEMSSDPRVAEQETRALDEAPPLPIEDDLPAEAVDQPTVEWIGNDDDASDIEGPLSEIPSAKVEEERVKFPEAQTVSPEPTVSIDADRSVETGTVDVASVVEAVECEGTLVTRLLILHEAIPFLGEVTPADIGRLVEVFPEGWPRRRALTALIEADLPVDAADILDLIARLTVSSDRRWCLAVLADRGDLRGPDADRALAMAESPSLRRRIRRLSGESL